MTNRVKGPFKVTLSPQATESEKMDASLGRLTIDKHFEGELEAHSKGQMLSAGGNVGGSGGYVAIEKVSGVLKGRKGSFILQHNATMNRGEPALNIIVVPDSGSDELTGLSGNMNIIIEEDGKHFYDFSFELGD